VTVIVKVFDSAIVGIPEIAPLVVSSASPLGKVFGGTLHMYGGVPPVAATVDE
jgi:hypothetical protein